MDLTEIPTEDLIALKSGDLTKVSTETLTKLKEATIDTSRFDAVRSSGGGEHLRDRLEHQAGLMRSGKPVRSEPRVGMLESSVLGTAEGVLGGSWLDEASGAINAGVDFLGGSDKGILDNFTRHREKAKRRLEASYEDNPGTHIAGNIAGGIATAPFLPGKSAAVAGGVYGLAAGAGQGDTFGERAMGAGIGAAVGTVAGGATDWLLGKLGRRAASQEASKAIDSALVQASPDELIPSKTYAQRTGDVNAHQIEEEARAGSFPDAITRMAQASDEQQKRETREAIGSIAGDIAGNHPPVADAADMGTRLKGSIEGAVAQDAAEEARQFAAANAIRERAGSSIGPAAPGEYELGETIAGRVRSGEQQARQARRQAYERVGQMEGEVSADAVEGWGQNIQRNLAPGGADDLVIDPVTTPAAARAIERIQGLSALRNPQNRAVAEGMPDPNTILGVSIRGIDQVRKQLLQDTNAARAAGRATGNWSDYYATRRIVEQFDDQLDETISAGMYRGDPNLLPALRDARALHRQFKQTYSKTGPGDDAGREIEKIARGERTPEEVANRLYNGTRIGERGTTTRLAQRLRDIVGPESPEWGQIRRHYWDRLTEAPEGGITRENAQTIASQIEEFTTNKGRSTALTMFDRGEIDAMGAFARGLRGLAAHRETTAEQLDELLKIARGNMNPTKLAESLVGSSGKSVGKSNPAWRLVEAVENVFGRNSDEFSAMRQASWAQLTRDIDGAQKMASNLGSFLTNSRPVAERLFSPQELRKMLQLKRELEMLVAPPRSAMRPNTAAHLLKRGRELIKQFAPAIATATGGLDAGATSLAINYGVDKATNAALKNRLTSQFAGQQPKSLGFEVERRALGAGRRIARQGQRLAPLSGQGAPRIPLERALANEEEQR
jgi:hypothetical protein